MSILYILGPSLLGFVGYSMLRRRTQRYLAQEPALERMVRQRVQQARDAQRHANLAELEQASWRARWTQLAAPLLGLTGYVAWICSDLHCGSMRALPVPLTTKDWLLIPCPTYCCFRCYFRATPSSGGSCDDHLGRYLRRQRGILWLERATDALRDSRRARSRIAPRGRSRFPAFDAEGCDGPGRRA